MPGDSHNENGNGAAGPALNPGVTLPTQSHPVAPAPRPAPVSVAAAPAPAPVTQTAPTSATFPTPPIQKLAPMVQQINPNQAGTVLSQMPQPSGAITAGTALGTAQTTAQVDPRDAATYDPSLTQQNVEQNGQMTAQQGTINEDHLVDAPQLDMQGAATGTNADGSTNETGNALKEYAKQDISNIIDTSTPSGKALAEQLGDGNYTDSKATLKGQLDVLQSEFQDADGNPKIPGWAAATARNVSKIAAFKGMTGSAATAAMSQALMEASIPVAQQDAQFFQTVTLQNLSNKQASTLNRANVLAKFDLTNIDNRMAAAVENSKAFLAMDMTNLDNRQQAEVINTQSRVQSILEDSKQINAQRLFTAESQNDMDKFYDSLNSSIQQFNATQTNAMTQFNATNLNDTSKFNADMENNRDQFYKTMQYNIDVANAKWRQQVTLQNNSNNFEAAATDVKNAFTMSQEQLNQIWDRSDALLDYAWKSSENAADRKNALLLSSQNNKAAQQAADSAGTGAIFGTIAGKGAEALLNWAFS